MLQLAKPAAQPVTWQLPVLHDAVALDSAHAVPQVPQLAIVFVGVSQPSFGLPLQSPKPAAHVGLQAPAVQAVLPFVFEQATPQAPQLLVVVIAVSQPSAGLLLQSAHPA